MLSKVLIRKVVGEEIARDAFPPGKLVTINSLYHEKSLSVLVVACEMYDRINTRKQKNRHVAVTLMTKDIVYQIEDHPVWIDFEECHLYQISLTRVNDEETT